MELFSIQTSNANNYLIASFRIASREKIQCDSIDHTECTDVLESYINFITALKFLVLSFFKQEI